MSGDICQPCIHLELGSYGAEATSCLVEIRLGPQMIASDRLDLDQWVTQYKARNGRPGKAMEGGTSCGHKSGRITTRYSMPEPEWLIAASNKACSQQGLKIDTMVILRKNEAKSVVANMA